MSEKGHLFEAQLKTLWGSGHTSGTLSVDGFPLEDMVRWLEIVSAVDRPTVVRLELYAGAKLRLDGAEVVTVSEVPAQPPPPARLIVARARELQGARARMCP